MILIVCRTFSFSFLRKNLTCEKEELLWFTEWGNSFAVREDLLGEL